MPLATSEISTPDPPCTAGCASHAAAAPTEVPEHAYSLHTHPEGWRWLCSCGSRGRFTMQSPNVPYHGWLRHVGLDR
jgi:hypothetical protein